MASQATRPSFASAYAKAVLNSALEPLSKAREDGPGTVPAGRICIVGAGSAGLTIALCLQHLGFKDIDIYEANNRVGGRIYTQTLDDSDDPHNYYDIGAMRIPQIDTMESTMNMITNSDIGLKLPNGQPLETAVADYFYRLPDKTDSKKYIEPSMYYWQSITPENLVHADDKFTNAVAAIADVFVEKGNFDTAFKDKVMTGKPQDSIDFYSTRMWLQLKQDEDKQWTYDQIEAAETMETSTGLFDQAFTETIIDYCDFESTKQQNATWKRLDGGMGLLTDAMAAKVRTSGGATITLGAPVTKMVQDSDHSITVTYNNPQTGQSKSKSYGTVFNTTALPCLERIDTSRLKLDDETLTAIRTLSYDRATKVAIKFSKNWWAPLLENRTGGVSSSDLPISNVVYPSWNDEGANNVLMVSYSWAQDATRMGALVPDYSDPPVNSSSEPIKPKKSDPVVTLCLQNLAKLWESKDGPTYQELSDMYVTHHAYAWSHDPYAGGAFALFGPGQFYKYYPTFFEMKCHGRFGIAGEATSAHHAWISGALDSAYVTVLTWLKYWGEEDKVAQLRASPYGIGQGKDPFEVDDRLLSWATLFSPGYERIAQETFTMLATQE